MENFTVNFNFNASVNFHIEMEWEILCMSEIDVGWLVQDSPKPQYTIYAVTKQKRLCTCAVERAHAQYSVK